MGERYAVRHARGWRFAHIFDTQRSKTSESKGLTMRTTVAATSDEHLRLEGIIYDNTPRNSLFQSYWDLTYPSNICRVPEIFYL